MTDTILVECETCGGLGFYRVEDTQPHNPWHAIKGGHTGETQIECETCHRSGQVERELSSFEEPGNTFRGAEFPFAENH